MRLSTQTITSSTTPREIPDGLELIGPIMRLQVQISPLKLGQRPASWYDPAPITVVPALRIDPGGIVGLNPDEAHVLHDVHHRDHALSRFRGENGVSIGFTSHYLRMQERFGPHLTLGIAGESIIIDTTRIYSEDDLRAGIVVLGPDGGVHVDLLQVAAPCVEFSKFAIRYPPDSRADRDVSEALKFLHQGTRGFYGSYQQSSDAPSRITTGNLVYRCLPTSER